MRFSAVWCLDFEFVISDGDVPLPVCMVAWELGSGRRIRLWEEELRAMTQPPFPTGPDVLFVGYYLPAEWSCFLALGWRLPESILDLFIEFRVLTNGRESGPLGRSILGALAHFGLDGIEANRKHSWRERIIQGGPWAPDERAGILDYCESDVEATAKLFHVMRARIGWPRALLRGRYTRAVAQMQAAGVPVDLEMLAQLRERWESVKAGLVADVDRGFGVYEGTVFKAARWEAWTMQHGIPWPRLESGRLALDGDTFGERAKSFPALAPMAELHATLAQLKKMDLTVGRDGRHRAKMLSMFGALTGRNTPRGFVFGLPAWLRGLIQPAAGCGLGYVDWSQQEFGIAAALSGDAAMLEAYLSGDPYLTFAKQAGAVPWDATKKSHARVREQFKTCALGIQYGMEAETLAHRINQPPARARELLELHRRTYKTFWRWSAGTLDYANLQGRLWTVFGWHCWTGSTKPTGLRNFLMQSNGAEMLRLACCLATDEGIRVVAPVHDAVLIEAPLPELGATVKRMQALMVKASAAVLGGFELASDVKMLRYPDRFMDDRGGGMWERVQRLLK